MNKTAVVTGGNKGIGLQITLHLLAEGYQVVVGARSSFPEIDSFKKLIFVKGDVSDQKFHEKLVSKVISEFGQLDLYVNNAGFSAWKPIGDISSKFLNDIFSTNLFSAFWGCKEAQSSLNKGGSIINISSIAGKRGSLNNSAYVATKFAMNGLTQSLAKELGPKGIRVNAICPVLISTDGLIEALSKEFSPGYGDPKKFIENFKLSQTALGRLPTGLEVANMVSFLASEKASAITGQCINVDCGVFPQ